jgi:hypothetical protein
MDHYHGMVTLGETMPVRFLVRNSSDAPVNADSVPSYRVYGPDGLVAGQTGSASLAVTGVVTGATNASPIVVTSAGHGLTTGTRVTVTGVGGNSAANGTFTVTAVSADTFSLDSSTGNGAYTSGGTWSVTGLYKIDVAATANNGYEAGYAYDVIVSALISGAGFGAVHSFDVA